MDAWTIRPKLEWLRRVLAREAGVGQGSPQLWLGILSSWLSNTVANGTRHSSGGLALMDISDVCLSIWLTAARFFGRPALPLLLGIRVEAFSTDAEAVSRSSNWSLTFNLKFAVLRRFLPFMQ